MQNVQKLLSESNVHGAARRFVEVVRAGSGSLERHLKEMAAILVAEYDALSVKPVLEFCQYAKQLFQPAQMEVLLEGLRPKAERTQHWIRELDDVTRERLGREARKEITLNNVRGAAQRATLLLNRAKNPADRERNARFLISALAGLVRDQDRSMEVMRFLAQAQMFDGFSFDWRQVFVSALEQAKRGGMIESDREWTKIFTTACVSIREFLPGKRDAGEPTEEQTRRFTDEALSLLRAGTVSEDDEDLIDALAILKEYCPTDPPTIQSVAGVEPRLFLDLGPRAKLAAVRGLGKIGEIALLRARILTLAQTTPGDDKVETFTAIMGGLRHNDFFFYLKTALRDAKTPKRQEAIADAVSRIANTESVDMVLGELAKCVKKAVDPTEERRAKMFLTALGRISKMKGVEASTRVKLANEVIALVGEKSVELSSHAALQIFSAKIDEFQPAQRAWAARQMTRALFASDQNAMLAAKLAERGGAVAANASNPLGSRGPAVQGLTRLGREALPEVLETAEPLVRKITGAFNAFAETMQKIGDERAAPLLERMIRVSFMGAGETSSDPLYIEKVYDPATAAMKDLEPDDIIHSLMFALDKCGGEGGRRALLGIADQLQAGQLVSPGGETSSFLLDIKRKHGTVGKREVASQEPREVFADEVVERALASAKGGMFSNKIKQIEGISILGRARRPDTVGVLLANLSNKDLMVQRAAETALTQFVSPLPSPKEFEQFVIAFFEEHARFSKGEAMEKVLQIIAKHFPKRAPYDEHFRRYAEMNIGDGALLFRLQSAIEIPDAPSKAPIPVVAPEVEAEKPEVENEAIETGRDDAPYDGSPPIAPSREEVNLRDRTDVGAVRSMGPLTPLDIKRQYMMKRQAWIKGGKQGPPPEPPA